MNNSKIWLVVKPTVGVPLFLSAVAVGSFAVHVAVLSNTSWVSDFLKGKPMQMSAAVVQEGDVQNASFDASDSNIVILPDGRKAMIIEDGERL